MKDDKLSSSPGEPILRLADAGDLKKPAKYSGATRRGRKVGIGLCLIILLACAVWGMTVFLGKVIPSAYRNVQLTDRAQADVVSIEIVGRDAGKVTLRREGEDYTADGLAREVLSQSACAAAFANAAELLAEDVAAERPGDLSGFGLAPPVATVIFHYVDDEYVLEIGDKAPTSNFYYARQGSGDTVYLIKGLLADLFAQGSAAFRDIASFAPSIRGIAALSLEKREERSLSLTRQSKTSGFAFSPWQITEPFLADAVTDKAEAVLEALADVRLTRYVGGEEALAPHGLDVPEETLRLTYADGSAFALSLGERDVRGNAYVQLNDEPDVYLADADSVAFIDSVALETLISEFSNIHSITNLSGLTVEMEGITTKYTVDRSGEEPTFFREGEPVDAAAFKSAFQRINELFIADILPERASLEGAAAVLTLTYEFTDGESGVVEYLDYNINNYALRKNGTSGVMVRKDAAEPMLRALLELSGAEGK